MSPARYLLPVLGASAFLGVAMGAGSTPVRIFDSDGNALVEPLRIDLDSQGGPYIDGLKWVGWGGPVATGTGTYESKCDFCPKPAVRKAVVLLSRRGTCPKKGVNVYQVGEVKTLADETGEPTTYPVPTNFSVCGKVGPLNGSGRPKPKPGPARPGRSPSRSSAACAVARGHCSRRRLAHSNFAGRMLIQSRWNKATLTGTSFRGSNLWRASFRFARLRRADLRLGNRTRTSFVKADLRRANLSGGDFWHSNFRGANLRGAIAMRTKFDEANLTGADLSGAVLSGSTFYGATLCRTIQPNGEVNNENCRGAGQRQTGCGNIPTRGGPCPGAPGVTNSNPPQSGGGGNGSTPTSNGQCYTVGQDGVNTTVCPGSGSGGSSGGGSKPSSGSGGGGKNSGGGNKSGGNTNTTVGDDEETVSELRVLGPLFP